MRVYARPGWRLVRQLVADSFVVLWVAGWAFVARLLHRAIAALAAPAREGAETAAQLSRAVGDAQGRLSELPVVGGDVAEPLGRVASGLDGLVGQADQQATQILHLATIASWTCFLVPVLGLLAVWLPYRVRFIRRAAAARRFVNADADLELFALRAMANLPMDQIAAISDDPVRAWRAGDQQVIRALAARELERTGLGMPAPVRQSLDHKSHKAHKAHKG